MKKIIYVFIVILLFMSGCNSKESVKINKCEIKLSGKVFSYFDQLYCENDKQFLLASDMNIYEISDGKAKKISTGPIVEPKKVYEEEGEGIQFVENNLFVINTEKYVYLGDGRYYQLNKKKVLTRIEGVSVENDEFLIRNGSLNALIKPDKLLLNINGSKKTYNLDDDSSFVCFIQDNNVQYIVFTKIMLVINNGVVGKYIFPYDVYGFSIKDDVFNLVSKYENTVIDIMSFSRNAFEKYKN